jgi:hypothetical protein
MIEPIKRVIKLCLITGTVILFAESTGSAQEFGAKIGASFSSISNDYRFEGIGPGLLIGGIVNYPLSDGLQVTGGLDYNQLKGSVQNSPSMVGTDLKLKESNITFHAIEASALLGYRLPLGILGEAAPYIQGGLAIAYNAATWDHYKASYYPVTDVSGSSSISEDSQLTFRGKENVGSLGDTWLPAWYVGLRFEAPLEEAGLFKKMFFDFRMRSSLDGALNVFPLNRSANELGIRTLSASIAFSF